MQSLFLVVVVYMSRRANSTYQTHFRGEFMHLKVGRVEDQQTPKYLNYKGAARTTETWCILFCKLIYPSIRLIH